MRLFLHQFYSIFKEIHNVFKIIKLLTIHTRNRFTEPIAYISLNHICQNLLIIGVQQFLILLFRNSVHPFLSSLAKLTINYEKHASFSGKVFLDT